MWITKGVRFEAQRRLIEKNNASNRVQSVLAIYVIVAGLLPLLFHVIPRHEVLNVVTIATSIFLLILNNQEAAQDYALRAERMLKCGQAISVVHDHLELRDDARVVTIADCEAALQQYNEILGEYSENHAHVDLHSFRANVRRNEPDGKNGPHSFHFRGWRGNIEVCKIRLWWQWDIHSYFGLLLIMPPILISLAFLSWHDVVKILTPWRR